MHPPFTLQFFEGVFFFFFWVCLFFVVWGNGTKDGSSENLKTKGKICSDKRQKSPYKSEIFYALQRGGLFSLVLFFRWAIFVLWWDLFVFKWVFFPVFSKAVFYHHYYLFVRLFEKEGTPSPVSPSGNASSSATNPTRHNAASELGTCPSHSLTPYFGLPMQRSKYPENSTFPNRGMFTWNMPLSTKMEAIAHMFWTQTEIEENRGEEDERRMRMQRATCKRNNHRGLWFFGNLGVENCV